MARVVEATVPDYGDAVRFEEVVTKNMAGAMRYGALSKSLGRPAPVPSIFVNGQLVFDATPSGEELKAWLDRHLASDFPGD